MPTTHHLEKPWGTLVFDVRGPLPATDGQPPLFMIGSPMDASGFTTLASLFADRTVVTYDPRGIGRSVRNDGRNEITPEQNAADVHDIIQALDAGPVEMFASSGGAVTALALLTTHPEDVTTVVAHEPPVMSVLPDAEQATAAFQRVRNTYEAKGSGAGMAAFIAMTSWQGEFTDDFAAAAPPDPAMFGLPSEDDGSRDDPLLSGRSAAVSAYRPDVEALLAAPARLVVAAGVESSGMFTGRTSEALAQALGLPLVVFPSHHGGFMGDEFGYAGQPEAFAVKLREVLENRTAADHQQEAPAG
ncbi:MAG TPA: alpha/beta hydrolase [Actinomycetales bacterium]|nr:alpha/beta hydrolase [Actinomycetales bacterium]